MATSNSTPIYTTLTDVTLYHELREAQRHAFLLSKRRAIAKVGLFLQMLETHQAARGRKHGRGVFADVTVRYRRLCRYFARGGEPILTRPR